MAVVIDGTNGISSPDYEVDGVTGQVYPVVSGTAVTASGTSVDFTGIPSWVKRITVMFSGVSTNGTSVLGVQLGDAGGIETTGYAVGVANTNNANGTGISTYTTLFALGNVFAAATSYYCVATLVNMGGNLWAYSSILTPNSTAAQAGFASGNKTLSDTLTQVRITTVGGTNTFDAGTINILYE